MSATELATVSEGTQAILELVEGLARGGAVTLTSLDLSDPDLPFERWESLGRYLGAMHKASRWWIADWLVFGEGVYGEKFAQAADATGLRNETLMSMVNVSRRVPKERRRDGLSFRSHEAVSRLDAVEQIRWLDRAEAEGWNSEDLRRAVKASQNERVVDDREPSDGDGDQDDHRARRNLLESARAVWKLAQKDGDAYRVPLEPMARLGSALEDLS